MVVFAVERCRSARFAITWKPFGSRASWSGGCDSVACTAPLATAAVAFATEPVAMLAMTLLYEALTLTGAGVALAAGGAAGVGAPPHAVRRRLATSPAERARCIFTPLRAGADRARLYLAVAGDSQAKYACVDPLRRR